MQQNVSSKDSVDPQWRSGGPGRGSRGGRMNFSSRHSSHDGAGAKNFFRKENRPKQFTDPSTSTSQQQIKTKDNALVSSLSTVMDKSSVGLTSGSSDGAPPSAVESSKNRVNTEQKSADSLPLSRPPSSEVRFTSSNSKPVSEQHLGQSKSQNRSRGVGKTLVNDAYVRGLLHLIATARVAGLLLTTVIVHIRLLVLKEEWKPKPVNHTTTQGSGASATAEALAVPTEASEKSVEDVVPSAEGTSKLQRQLEDLQVQRQHVIIPNHILVPDAERTKFSFGSFDAGFSIASSSVAFPENEKRSAPLSQNSQEVEDSFEEDELRNNSMSSLALKFKIGTPGSQLPQFENADPQARDALRIPNFVVQQPFDTASYYAQFYRSGPDSDGRVSPFVSPGLRPSLMEMLQYCPSFISNHARATSGKQWVSCSSSTPGAAATGVKYTLPHHKPGNNNNTGNLTHVAGNSTSNEDLNTLQLKENNGYSTTGQQSEALPVWIAGPGRDVPSSFYGLQHHGQQHVTYAPAQAGHVTFPGMYHPGQAVTAAGGVHHPLLQQSQGVAGAEMVAPGPPNVFQQPQQTPMNWPSNY
ncbi:hypothetical protein Bca52824_067028 [Brassica carinata]|uniref:Uncharacterized protein n=1 Tax=Brassica carinata TaxID=52824 RepID=A0A8X7QMK7_BRACI|nr:hypothetical protein Bca52824_067028 [Brassica carinata]